jgi:hypothetical protein
MPDVRRARLYKQQSRRTGKADGFAPIIEPAWEGSSNLVSPSCVEKGRRPRADQKSISLAQSASSGLFAAAELTGDRLA